MYLVEGSVIFFIFHIDKTYCHFSQTYYITRKTSRSSIYWPRAPTTLLLLGICYSISVICHDNVNCLNGKLMLKLTVNQKFNEMFIIAIAGYCNWHFQWQSSNISSLIALWTHLYCSKSVILNWCMVPSFVHLVIGYGGSGNFNPYLCCVMWFTGKPSVWLSNNQVSSQTDCLFTLLVAIAAVHILI